MPDPVEPFDRSLPQLGLPKEVAEELVQAELATRGGRQEFGLLDPEGVGSVIIAVTSLSGAVVTLTTQSDEAWRRLCVALARWRRKTTPPRGKSFSLVVRRGGKRAVGIELGDEPDPDVLLAFLRSALAHEPDEGPDSDP